MGSFICEKTQLFGQEIGKNMFLIGEKLILLNCRQFCRKFENWIRGLFGTILIA